MVSALDGAFDIADQGIDPGESRAGDAVGAAAGDDARMVTTGCRHPANDHVGSPTPRDMKDTVGGRRRRQVDQLNWRFDPDR